MSAAITTLSRRLMSAILAGRAGWQGWSSAGGWGKPPTPLFPDRVGEMSIRQIDGKPVLSYFNGSEAVAIFPALSRHKPLTEALPLSGPE